MDEMGAKVGLRTVELRRGYRSGADSLIDDFYLPCLAASDRYDRAVGYFSSTLFALAGIGLSDFALRGGRIRLVASPAISPVDADAVRRGLATRDIGSAVVEDLHRVLKDPTNRPVVELLATLVAYGTMDLRLAFRPGYGGIFHDKIGIFGDKTGDLVSFVGSANETFVAWDPGSNHESVEVFRSWEPDDAARVEGHSAYFASLWSNGERGVLVVELPDAPRALLAQYVNKDGVSAAVDKFRVMARGAAGDGPHLPELMPHQMQVVKAWHDAGDRGIIAHATGSGKTIAAISIIRDWIASGRCALIVVPTQILLEQWLVEIERLLGNRIPVLQVGAGQAKAAWGKQLGDFTRNVPGLGPRIVVSTLATASTQGFLRQVRGGSHVLLVIDEVHRAGSPQARDLLAVARGGSLGLSATPERFGDPDGTRVVLEAFGPVLQPKFTLGDAIEAGRLVPYDYFVHLVQMTKTEADAWDRLTKQIEQEYARAPDDNGTKVLTERIRILLIRRARIIKLAEAKVPLAAELVTSHFKKGQHWLLYCEDLAQLRRVLSALSATGVDVFEYHSAMDSSRKETLNAFGRRGGVLVAIRCLDEGVDIPVIDHALILASSSNPREFIQRRGRVLRSSPGKYNSSIHDVLVTRSGQEGNVIVDSDLKRAILFAEEARNTSALHELEIVSRRAAPMRIDEDVEVA